LIALQQSEKLRCLLKQVVPSRPKTTCHPHVNTLNSQFKVSYFCGGPGKLGQELS
jgi:hypothetical protein